MSRYYNKEIKMTSIAAILLTILSTLKMFAEITLEGTIKNKFKGSIYGGKFRWS